MTGLSPLSVMSNTSHEAVSSFNAVSPARSALPAVPNLPPLPPFTTPTSRIPKSNELLMADATNDEDAELSIEELRLKYPGDSPGFMAALRAKKARYDAAHPPAPDALHMLLGAITDADAFMRKTIPKPPELISGVLYQGDKMCLNAGSKIGKTWHLLRLGLSVSEGIPWMGHATTKAKVLFVNFELKDHVTQDRVRMVKNDILPNVETTNFHLLNLRNLGMRPETLASVLPEFADAIKTAGYGMIIFDPIYKMYGWDMDENSAGDVAQLMNTLEMFANKTGASIVYSHHYAKGGQAGKASIDRASGSGVFARDPDAIVNITGLEDNDENTSYRVDLQLRCFKPVKPFGIRVLEGSVTLDNTLKLNNIKKPGQYKPQFSAQDILDVLIEEPRTTGGLIKAVKDKSGMSETQFYKLFKDVKNVEGVSQDSKKRWLYDQPACVPGNN